MWKGFVIAMVAALAVVSCTAVISASEDSQALSKHEGCDKNKDGKCTHCKCQNCENAECDPAHCACEGCEHAGSKCAASPCANCQGGSCHCEANGGAGCGEAHCAEGKCCCESSCDALGGCKGEAESGCSDSSTLHIASHPWINAGISSTPSVITDELWQRIANELGHSSSGPCEAAAPKTFVYLILDSEGGDIAMEAECGESATVSSVLGSAVLPHPVNFADAEIAVCRPRALVKDSETIEMVEQTLPVRWDQTTGQPTKCTDHALRPNDRVCVKIPASACPTPHAIATAYTQAAGPTQSSDEDHSQNVSTDDIATQVQYSIQIIEDRDGCMKEYEALGRGEPMMFAESKSLLPAMRILTKQQLIKQLSSPKIQCTVGQTAQMEIGNTESEKWEGVRLEMSSRKADNGLIVNLAIESTEDNHNIGVRTALWVEPGQTIVLKTSDRPAQQGEESPNQPAVYVVLTPEIVK